MPQRREDNIEIDDDFPVRPGKAEVLRDQLTCPECEYSLRGLSGEVVTCPECGCACNIVSMMTREWNGPWHTAPGFAKLLSPVTALGVGSLVIFTVYILEGEQSGHRVVTALTVVATIAVWMFMIRRTRHIPNRDAGVRLALLAHALFAGYAVGVGLGIWLIIAALYNQSPMLRLTFVALLPVPILICWLMRRWERHIAELCIRAWLNVPTIGNAVSEEQRDEAV